MATPPERGRTPGSGLQCRGARLYFKTLAVAARERSRAAERAREARHGHPPVPDADGRLGAVQVQALEQLGLTLAGEARREAALDGAADDLVGIDGQGLGPQRLLALVRTGTLSLSG